MKVDITAKRSSWLVRPIARWIIFAALLVFQTAYFGFVVGFSTAAMFLVLDLLVAAKARVRGSNRYLFWGRLLSLIVAFLIVGLANSIITSKSCDSEGNCEKILLT